VIVLHFPDGGRRQLEDADARQLVERLWEIADRARVAVVASAIERELRRNTLVRKPVAVPPANASRVTDALARLAG
jgi:hypothetical protein